MASLFGKSAAYLKHRMRYQEEKIYHQQALHLREQVVGPDHILLVESLIGLAEANWYLHKHISTVTYAQQAIGILERTQGVNAFTLIKPLIFLAQVCRVQGTFAEAEKLLLRALSIWTTTRLEETDESMRPEVITTPSEKQKTQALIQQALSLWAQNPQHYHDQIGHILSILSQVYQQQQRHKEAEAILIQQIPIGRQALGENHYIFAIPLRLLAEVRKGQGKLEEASQLYNQILSICEQALGPQHPQTREARTIYISLLQHISKWPAEQ